MFITIEGSSMRESEQRLLRHIFYHSLCIEKSYLEQLIERLEEKGWPTEEAHEKLVMVNKALEIE